MNVQILPLAVTMMAGPQIMSAIILVTHKRAVTVSLAFLVGVAAAMAIGLPITTALASLLATKAPLGDSSDVRALGTLIQLGLVALLIVAAIRNYVRRTTIEPPTWLGTLLSATPTRAFATGLLLILLMPSDIAVMLTVGVSLAQSDSPLTAALPFVGLTLLIAALPLLGFLVFHRRAELVMPTVRDWMNSHSWLINITVYGIFIALILA